MKSLEAQQIIQEALILSYQREPKTILEWLFHIGPSNSRIKSSVIWYLTQRLMSEQKRANEAEIESQNHIRRANQELSKYNIRL